MTAVENVAATVVASCKGNRTLRIAITSTLAQTWSAARIARRYGSTAEGKSGGGAVPADRPSASSDVLEQLSPLRSNINKTALCILFGIRTRPAYQLGGGLIVKIESVSNAGAQRVEFPSTPFDNGKALTVGYEQIMLLLGNHLHQCHPLFCEEQGRSWF